MTPQIEKISKVDLLIHPVRMRIMVALAGQQLTAQQLMKLLPDIAQATLYRHLGVLTQQQVLKVVEERPNRGTVEKVYAMSKTAALLGPDDLAHMSQEEHLQTFMIFLVSLLDEFQRYVVSEPTDFVGDGFSYRAMPLFLSDAEFNQIAFDVSAALLPHIGNVPSPDRRRRVLATISIPDPANSQEK